MHMRNQCIVILFVLFGMNLVELVDSIGWAMTLPFWSDSSFVAVVVVLSSLRLMLVGRLRACAYTLPVDPRLMMADLIHYELYSSVCGSYANLLETPSVQTCNITTIFLYLIKCRSVFVDPHSIVTGVYIYNKCFAIFLYFYCKGLHCWKNTFFLCTFEYLYFTL